MDAFGRQAAFDRTRPSTCAWGAKRPAAMVKVAARSHQDGPGRAMVALIRWPLGCCASCGALAAFPGQGRQAGSGQVSVRRPPWQVFVCACASSGSASGPPPPGASAVMIEWISTRPASRRCALPPVAGESRSGATTGGPRGGPVSPSPSTGGVDSDPDGIRQHHVVGDADLVVVQQTTRRSASMCDPPCPFRVGPW